MTRVNIDYLTITFFIFFAVARAHVPGENWGYENPDMEWPSQYPECAGQRQSPIDVVTSRTVRTVGFMHTYQSRLASTNLSVVNDGYSVELNVEPRGVYISSSKFPDLHQAMNIHWHMPSEHRLDGKQYAGEMHIVHRPIDRAFWSDGRVPVVCIAYLIEELDDSTIAPEDLYAWQRSNNDSILNAILDHDFSALAENNEPQPIRRIPRIPYEREFYIYDGSWTSPPCEETVEWWIGVETLKVPKRQLSDLSGLLRKEHGGPGGGARPVQPLNGRDVLKFDIESETVKREHFAPNGGSNSVSGKSGSSGSPATIMNFIF